MVVLTLLLISCKSTKIPVLEFPEFPTMPDVTITDDGVLVPGDWLIDLAEYKLRIDMLEKTYKEITR